MKAGDLIKRYGSFVLVIAALVYLGVVFWSDWPTVFNIYSGIDITYLSLSLFVGYFSFIAGSGVFHELVIAYTVKNYSIFYSIYLYTMGQLMKHIPGKIWDYAFHINELRNDAAIKINFHLMVLTYGINLGCALMILLMIEVSVFCILPGLVLIYLGVWAVNRILPNMLVLLSRKIKHFRGVTLHSIRIGSKKCVRMYLLKSIEWTLYVLAWWLLMNALMPMEFNEASYLCAIYTLAWLGGVMVFIVPSGIGVRELIFIALGKHIHMEEEFLLSFALLTRFWFLIIEVMMAFSGLMLNSFKVKLSVSVKE